MLEARDRVGGRIWTHPLPDGTPVDRGGAWLGPNHDRIFGLASEVGVSTYKTWVKGAHLLIDHGRARRYTGLIPKISPLGIITLTLAQARLNRMARQLPVDAPWSARRADDWDSRSVAWWLERSGVRTQIAQDLFEMAVRGLMTGDLSETSLLHLLFLVRGHGSINTLFSIENGAQENMVDGGAGAIAQRVADELGEAVRLEAPVRSLAQRADRVVVDSRECLGRRLVTRSSPSRRRWCSTSSSILCFQTTTRRSTATTSRDRRRRRWSCTTSRSGGTTGSAGSPRSREQRRRSRSTRRRRRAVLV